MLTRYDSITREKADGATYTPSGLSHFVARQIVDAAGDRLNAINLLRVLDPAVGDGELLISLADQLTERWPDISLELHGFETDQDALTTAKRRLKKRFPKAILRLEHGNFLEHVIEHYSPGTGSLFANVTKPRSYDLIIANPPYVRTQIMGAEEAQAIARRFRLSGRVDLYHAFIIGMAWALKSGGVAGIIVSNRFMSTKSGAAVRRAILKEFNLRHVWDLGDTKLFDAAVLPAVLLVEGKNGHHEDRPAFTSIYQTTDAAEMKAETAIEALSSPGVIEISDGRRFRVQHGKLCTGSSSDAVWRVATQEADAWLETVKAHTWGTFRDIGKIRVGVKTCADQIFIRSDWETICAENLPELLRPVITHHIGRRFKACEADSPKQILYPHETAQGRRRAADLSDQPHSRAYLERHRSKLESRSYVLEAGRHWYEIWVPQDPDAWKEPKLIFRDISQEPVFWLDLDGAVVNGDCYWLVPKTPEKKDLLWLAAAVGNSTFIERFYDYRFNNKLYAGRRRFITQYVEKFPLPDPETPSGEAIITTARRVYEAIPSAKASELEEELDAMVWRAFGLPLEEVGR